VTRRKGPVVLISRGNEWMMKKRSKATSNSAPRLWWVFRLKSGEIKKAPGTELRDEGDSFDVRDERIPTLFVAKADVVDHWAQDRESHPREYQSFPQKTAATIPHV
jgi:hypothetical protein